MDALAATTSYIAGTQQQKEDSWRGQDAKHGLGELLEVVTPLLSSQVGDLSAGCVVEELCSSCHTAFPSFWKSLSEAPCLLHADGPTFRVYRRRKTCKAPRKRTFIMHMTKTPDALIEALGAQRAAG